MKKEIALLYHAAFLVIARNDVALHLRVDVGVDESVQCRDAFKHARHVTRLDGCDQDFRRVRRDLSRLSRTTSRNCDTDEQSDDKRNRFHVMGDCGVTLWRRN